LSNEINRNTRSLSSSTENLTSDDSIHFNDIFNTIDDESRNIPVEIDESPNLRLVLSRWALRHNITHAAVNDLLKNLKQFPLFSDLPSDARTLLKTSTTAIVKTIGGGVYHYFGIKKEVEFLVDSGLNLPSELLLVAGIDGLPITSNPPSQLWPILGYFSNINSVRPSVFIIGVFYGKTKPENSNEYLRDFVDELKYLCDCQNNIIRGQHISIKLHALICDAPAKSFVLNCKGHTGKNSCVRCTCNGQWLDGRACFPGLDATLRTHDNFVLYNYINFHISNTILSEIPHFNLISSIPYDYMHLVLIGAAKKLLLFWTSKKNIHSLPSNTIKALDQKLILLSQYIPVDFQRTPNKNSRCHPFGDVNRWKTTELRQCLLYTGFVIFQDILSNQIYTHFKELSIALRILLTENINEEYIAYSSNLIRHFVESFKDIYGTSSISHNIHALIHLPEDYKKYGSLENISAFPFESFMQPIKKKN